MNKSAFIMINWNGYEDTLECVSSIRLIDKNFPIIIIDNNSDHHEGQRLREKFKNDSNVQVILSDMNSGFCGGNNIGFRYAKKHNYRYAIFINNDTVIDKKFIERFLILTHNEDFCLMGAYIYDYYKRSEIQSKGITINSITGISRNVVSRGPLDRISVSGTCFVVDLLVLPDDKFLLDEDYFCYYEEVDLCQRMLRRNCRVIIHSDLKVFHKGSVAANKISGFTEYQSIRNRFLFVKKNFSVPMRFFHLAFQFLYLPAKLVLLIKKTDNFKYFVAGFYDGLKILFGSPASANSYASRFSCKK